MLDWLRNTRPLTPVPDEVVDAGDAPPPLVDVATAYRAGRDFAPLDVGDGHPRIVITAVPQPGHKAGDNLRVECDWFNLDAAHVATLYDAAAAIIREHDRTVHAPAPPLDVAETGGAA